MDTSPGTSSGNFRLLTPTARYLEFNSRISYRDSAGRLSLPR